MKVPQSFLEGFIMVLFMIPVTIFLIIKWLVKGIIVLIMTIKNN